MQAYPGSVQSPFPPRGDGWAVVGYGDALAAARARQLSQYRDAHGNAGLPLWHCHDEIHRSGVYCFFSFLTHDGHRGIGAMRFMGRTGPLGATDGSTPAPTDGGTTTDPGATDGGYGGPPGGVTQGPGQGGTDTGGVNVDAPGGGGGGGGGTTTPTKPAPAPAQPAAPATSSSSSSSTPIIVGVIAALAVAGVVIAGASAKHPTRSGRTRVTHH